MDKVTELSKMIDHSLLHPTMTDEDLKTGCTLARAYNTASVCIKPYAVREAKQWLNESDVLICTVIGFPHGNSTIAVKVFETEQACLDGAHEIDMVVNIGKVLSKEGLGLYKEGNSRDKQSNKRSKSRIKSHF